MPVEETAVLPWRVSDPQVACAGDRGLLHGDLAVAKCARALLRPRESYVATNDDDHAFADFNKAST